MRSLIWFMRWGRNTAPIGSFVMNSKTAGRVRKLKDMTVASCGRMVWQRASLRS